MSDTKFKESLDLAIEALSAAIENREDLERQLNEETARIENLRDAVRGLAGLCGVDYEVELAHLLPINPDLAKGITETVLEAIDTNPEKYFSATGMRDYLKEKGYEIDKYSNVLATIHTVLKRLYNAEKIERLVREGRTLYTWKSPF